MKRILLPTDFSENAYNALSYGVQLFADEECTFYLLNTYTPLALHTGMMIDMPSYAAIQLEEVTKRNSMLGLKKTEKRLKKEFSNPNHSFEKISTFNLLISEIVDCVAAYNIDLIVMGTQGATGAKEVFLGTHTMFTIKNVKCPVIAVPSGFKFESPQEILFATDYRFSKTNNAFSLIKHLCMKHLSRLNILNAYNGIPLDNKQESMKKYLDDYFKGNAHLFHIVEGVDVLEAVNTFQVKSKINFLIMIHNKHSFFENLLFKPVINQIVYHTNVPVLVIPSEERVKLT